MQQLVVSAALVDHKYLGAGEIDPIASHIPSASACKRCLDTSEVIKSP